MRGQILLLFIGTLLIVGCSSDNPVITSQNDISQTPIITSSSVMGVYELTIDADSISAELNQKRLPAIGESWTLSGKSFFDTYPCKDCFRISGLGYEDGRILVKFSLRHPFPKGNLALPPAGKNRLDLDLFDLALVVAPRPLSPQHYSLINIDIQDDVIYNLDGFTRELSNVTGFDVALPYVLVVDDSANIPPSSTFNKFEMGASKDFKVKFLVGAGETLVFDLYLTFGYGFSAVLADRLNPKYYNPEFNRKAAWKVEVLPPNGINPPAQGNTWGNFDSSTEYNVTVKVYDWQIGANVDPDLLNPTDIYAASDVDHVSVEIPGMTNLLKQVDGNSYVPGGTGMPGSPLVYSIPIANENLLAVGEYVGLVEVHDEREPQDLTKGRDYLIHSPDGVTLNQYQIVGYITYQTFIATVIAGEPVGNLIWAKCAGGSSDYDAGEGITTLSDNSTVVTGYFAVSATFGPGELNQTVLTSAGMTDIFIARYNPDGTLAWGKRVGGSDYDEGYGITTLSDNSTVVTGSFVGSATFGPGESNETVLTSDGVSDIFIARYNPDGTIAWAKRAGGSYKDYGYGITTLSDNSTVVTGWFDGSATFGPGEPNQTVLTSAGPGDIFIAQYNPNGRLAWVKRAGGLFDVYSRGITTLSGNSTVVTGYFSGSATFGPGEVIQTVLTSDGGYDIFIARYNPNGTIAWAMRAGGLSEDEGRAVTTLSDNSTVVTGSFRDIAIFGPGEINETILTSAGGPDIFIARYNPDISLSWAKRAGGAIDDSGNGITTLSDNSTVLTGWFYDSATFGPGEINQTVLTSAGYYDIFIVRYNPDGTLFWAKRAGGSVWADSGYGITTLSDNSTVVTGFFTVSATFGPGEPNQTFLSSAGLSDIFIARFTP